MGFSRDFDRITITDNGSTIRVEATSLLNGVPSPGDPATAISVVIVALPYCDVTLVSAPVDIPVGTQWRALFPGAVEKLRSAAAAGAHGPSPADLGAIRVYLIGIADDPDLEEQYVWGEPHSLVTQAV